jgi:hypothetical protein
MGNTALKDALDAVESERVYQENRWGSDFDDKNTVNDWVSYITAYAGRAVQADTPKDAYIQLMKVGTLAVAAMESFNRNNGFPPRHYDGDN